MKRFTLFPDHKIATSAQNITLLLLLAILCLAASCNKDDDMPPPEPELPPLTTEGLNTFGCYINGEPWVAEIPPLSEITGIRKIEAFLNPTSRFFGIKSRKTNQDGTANQRLSVLVENINQEGIYDNKYSPEIYWDVNEDCQYYELDTNYIHVVNIIKFDTISRIASGTFEYNLINSICNDTLLITAGRFDLQFIIAE